MCNASYSIAAGFALRQLVKEHYASQQEFAEDFGAELRTVNRYITDGINKLVTVEEIAGFFTMDLLDYLRLGKKLMESNGGGSI